MAIENTAAIRFEALAEGFRRGVDEATKALSNFEKGAKRAGDAVENGKKVNERAVNGIKGLESQVKNFNDTIRKGKSPISDFIRSNQTLGDVISNATRFVAGLNPVVAIAGTVALLAARQITKLVNETTALGDQLFTLSKRTGLSVSELSGLRVGAELANTSLADLQRPVRFLNRLLSQAADGSALTRKRFAEFGVEIFDSAGKIKPLSQVIGLIGDELSKVEDESLRAGKAQSVYGFSVQRAIPFLGLAAKEQEKLTRETQAYGGFISDKFGQQADQYRDNLLRLRLSNQGLRQEIAEQILPALNFFLKQLLKLDLAFKLLDAGGRNFRANISLTIASLLGIEPAARAVEELADSRKRIDVLSKAFAALDETAETAADGLGGLGDTADDLTAQMTELERVTKEVLDPFEERFQAIFESLSKEPEAVGRRFVTLAEQIAKLGGAEARAGLNALVQQLSQVAGVNLEDTIRRIREIRAEIDLLAENQALLRELEERPISDIGIQETAARKARFGAEVPGPREAQLDLEQLEVPDLDFETPFQKGVRAAEEFFATTVDLGQESFQALGGFADGFANALTSGADLAKIKFGDFFKQLLRDLLRAIVRAIILKTILSIFGGGLGSIGKTIQAALGAGGGGTGGFPQREEAALAGRAQIARGAGSLEQAAASATQNLAPQINVQVFEPGPLTKIILTDTVVIPRLRQRLRQLGEESFTR